MANTVTKDLWGAVLFRGIAAVLFGIAAVFWPGITLVTLVYLFSAYVLASGLITLVTSIVGSDEVATNRFLAMVVAVIEIGVGVYLLRHPSVTFKTLILIIGFVLIVRGVIDIVGGLFGEGISATQKLITVITGALAAVVGVDMLFQPEASGVAFVWILGLYALIAGPLLIAISLDLKNAK